MGQYQTTFNVMCRIMMSVMASLVLAGAASAMSITDDDKNTSEEISDNASTASEPVPSAVIVRRSARTEVVQDRIQRNASTRERALSAAWLDTPELFNSTTRAADVAGEGWEQAVRQERDDFVACLETGGCGRHVVTWQPIVEQASNENRFAALQRINNAVNERLSYRSDLIQYDDSDYWMTAEGFLTNSVGDCEDYALAKLWLLTAAGIDPEDMFIMVVQDTIVRMPHAFLAVRMGPSFVILDNRTNNILLPDNIDGIIPVITVGSEETYVHRRSIRQVSNPIRIASLRTGDDLS